MKIFISRFLISEKPDGWSETNPVSECEVDGNEVKSTTATSAKVFQDGILLFISCVFVLFCPLFCQAEPTYASLSPVPTEIVYALGAQDRLLGVSTTCNYPEDTKNKPKIGDTYFVNMELLMKLQPDYLFAMNSAKAMLGELRLTKTKPVYFEFSSVNDIYGGIREIAKIVEREQEGEVLIRDIKEKIVQNKTMNPQKILYIVQTEPIITIGNKSFINDVIKQSGHISVTDSLNYYYPIINADFAMKAEPDVIIIAYPDKVDFIKTLFPDTPIFYLHKEQQDIINRSGPRVYEAVKLFAELDFPTSFEKGSW